MSTSHPQTRARWQEYALAVAITAATVALRILLPRSFTADRPLLILFVIPMLVSAYFGGAGPGLLSTALVVIGTALFSFAPDSAFTRPLNLAQWLILLATGVLGTVLCEALHRARRRAEEVAQKYRESEEARRETGKLFEAINDLSTTVIYAKDLAGRYLMVNRRYTELFHVSKEAVLGRTDRDIFPRDLADAFRAMDERVVAAGVALTAEEIAPHDDGPHTYVSVKSPLRDSAGSIYGVFGISTDITDRKRAEEALRASEERTRAIVETALDAVITIDSAGVITGWSPQAEKIFGWPMAEALGRSLAETIVPEQYRAAHTRGMRRFLATGEAAVLNRRIELTALHRDGREFPIELAITPLRLDGQLSFSAFVRDITERKQAAEAVAASERHYRLIFEESPLPKWVYDLETLQFLVVNRAAQAHYGYSEAEFLAMTIRDIRPEEDISALEADVAQARGSGSRSGEWRHRKKDGSLINVIVTAHDIQMSGRPARLVVAQDITERKQSEAALRRSEERFRALVTASSDVIYRMSADWTEMHQLRGRDFIADTEVTSDTWFQRYIHPKDQARVMAAIREAIASKGVFSLEHQVVRVDGSLGWTFSRAVPLLDARGGITEWFGAASDITARKNAEEELRASEERFRGLAEALPQLVWTCRPDGWCDYLSRQWVDYTGSPAEQQLGYGWAEHLHPDDRARVQAEWEQATKRGDFLDVEFRIQRGDGAYRWFKTRAVPLRDATGRIVKWFGSNTDIEDNKLAEQKLKIQLGRLNLLHRITRAIGERQDVGSILQVVIRSIEDDLPVDFSCVGLHDPTAQTVKIIRVGVKSSATAMELAMPEQAVVPIDENGLSRCVRGQLVYEPDISEVPFPFPQRLARGGLRALVVAPLQVESRVFGVLLAARRDARSFSSSECEFLKQLSEHVALASHQAQLYGALQQAYDDLRQTQQAIMQQERLRALGQMASGIAHDINNAISPVALYTESLLENESGLSARAREYLTTIQHAIDDVAQTVSRMREFYRQRESQLTLTPVSLNRVAEQVADLTRARWSDMPQQRGVVIKMKRELATDLPAIMGVESEIREALTNLVFNAVDAMPAGGTLTLRTRLIPAHKGNGDCPPQVSLEVTDTGVGMDEDTRRRCLEPFFTTKGERGTGLGLAMVYGTVQRHSADLDIDSALGRGTTVGLRFAIPAVTPAPTPASMHEPRPRGRLRVLVVDDDPLLIKSLRDILESDGHEVVAATGGQDGIAAFGEAFRAGKVFSAVITDLGMPHVDGSQVASAIKALSPATPIILLTGWGQRLIDEGEVPPHVDHVLNKPPKLRELRAALAATIA